MITWMKGFILSSILVVIMCEEELIVLDFEYSKYKQQGALVKPQMQFIKPRSQIYNLQSLNRSKGCQLLTKLQIEHDKLDIDINIQKRQQQFNRLKNDVTEMLKISQEIKKKKNNVQELVENYYFYQNVTVVNGSHVDMLERKEKELKNIKYDIQGKKKQLKQILELENPNNNWFILSQLKFEMDHLQKKLGYLKKIRSSKQNTNKPINIDEYNRYFLQLQQKLAEHNRFVQNIIEEYNRNNYHDEIQKLQKQIQFINLRIFQENICDKQWNDIQKYQNINYQNQQILTLMNKLQLLKNNQQNSKYCQGVVKKLQQRVKNVLKFYDYTYGCAKNLTMHRQQKKNKQHELQLLKIQFNKNKDRNVSFAQYYKYIQSKKYQFNHFNQLPQDPTKLNNLIKQTQQKLKQVQKKYQQLRIQGKNKHILDHQKIKNLIYNIKILTKKFCQQYQIYDQQYNKLNKINQKSKAQIKYKMQLENMYNNQYNQLNQLQSSFLYYKNKVLDGIQKFKTINH